MVASLDSTISNDNITLDVVRKADSNDVSFILSDTSDARMSLRSEGELVTVRGRCGWLNSEGVSVEKAFTLSINDAKDVKVNRSQSNQVLLAKLGLELDDCHFFTITATGFAKTARGVNSSDTPVAVKSITLELMVYSNACDGNKAHVPGGKSILAKAFVEMGADKSNDKSVAAYNHFIDHIVLFQLRASLPDQCALVKVPVSPRGEGMGLSVSVAYDPSDVSALTGEGEVHAPSGNGSQFEFNTMLQIALLAGLSQVLLRLSEHYSGVYLASLVFLLLGKFQLYFGAYILCYKAYFSLLPETVIGRRSFFVNGWQAWSFCGSILQGNSLPIYSMPAAFVRAFHDGGMSVDINLKGSRRHYRTLLARALQQVGRFDTLTFLLRLLFDSKVYYSTRAPKISTDASAGLLGDAEEEKMASDMFASLSDRISRASIVCGFLTQKEQFGCISVNAGFDLLTFYLCCDGVVRNGDSTLDTDWCFLNFQNEGSDDPLAEYMRTAAVFNGVSGLGLRSGGVAVPAGWCSWYHFFADISESKLISNIETMNIIRNKSCVDSKRHGFDLFQIDDGYQKAWGDWLTLDEAKFPKESMGSIVSFIKESDLRPGLWLAPFACDKHSTIAANHFDWVLKNGSTGVPANSANCGKWFYGLDVTNKSVQEFIKHTIGFVVNDWGFRYLKLDFLYAASLASSQASFADRTVTRAQAMQIAMSTVRGAAGDETFILGCGAPLGSALGYVQANRVSADAGLSWTPELPLPFWDKWNLPSAKSMIRNTINRMAMHGRWWINDPDCLLLRDNLKFTHSEVVSIATVKALSGGSLIISDDLREISTERFKIAQKLLPATNVSATPLDLIDKEMPETLLLKLDGWCLLGLFNWDSWPKAQPFYVSTLTSLFAQAAAADGIRRIEIGGMSAKDRLPMHFSKEYKIVHCYDFWSETYSHHFMHVSVEEAGDTKQKVLCYQNRELARPALQPHACLLCAVRLQSSLRSAAYIGSNLHFSCGLELKSFAFASKGAAYSKTCTIVFSEGMIRENSWDPFVVVYLPFSLPGGAADLAVEGTMVALRCEAVDTIVDPEDGSLRYHATITLHPIRLRRSPTPLHDASAAGPCGRFT